MTAVRSACRHAATVIVVSTIVGCGSETQRGQQSATDAPYLIKDIEPGPRSSDPGRFMLSGRFAYFVASDTEHGPELWRTDGTAAGTILVKDIVPGPYRPDQGISSPNGMTDVNGILFFAATDPEHGNELWKSDGTEVGTILVKDINPGPQSSLPTRGSSFPSSLTNVNGTLFFVACDEEHGNELWTSDGTVAGTRLVKDIYPGPGVTAGSNYSPSVCLDSPRPSLLTPMNGVVYFFHELPELGREPWRSDGTAEGTYLVKDTHPGPDPVPFPSLGSVPPPPRTAVVKGTLFFESMGELWKTDGTAEGTVRVATDGFPHLLTASRDFAFFADARGLCRSDGTTTGTMLLKPLTFGISFRFQNRHSDIRGTDRGVFFDAATPEFGYEPWFSDGTPEGTRQIGDINPGSQNSNPKSAVLIGRSVYFYATDSEHGLQLWRTDEAGMVLRRLTDLPNSSSPSVGPGPNVVVFSAADVDHGVELWGLHPAAGE